MLFLATAETNFQAKHTLAACCCLLLVLLQICACAMLFCHPYTYLHIYGIWLYPINIGYQHIRNSIHTTQWIYDQFNEWYVYKYIYLSIHLYYVYVINVVYSCSFILLLTLFTSIHESNSYHMCNGIMVNYDHPSRASNNFSSISHSSDIYIEFHSLFTDNFPQQQQQTTGEKKKENEETK